TRLVVIRASDGVLMPALPLKAPHHIATEGETGYVCCVDGALWAFRLSDGQRLWTAPVTVGQSGPSSDCVLVAAEGTVYCSYAISPPAQRGQPSSPPAILFAWRGSDGPRLWHASLLVPPPLLVHHGVVYVVADVLSSPGRPSTRSLVALRAADGSLRWAIPVGSTTPGIIATDATMFFAEGMRLRAVRATDGPDLWRYQRPYPYVLRVAATGGVVFASIYSNGLEPTYDSNTFAYWPYLLALDAGDGHLYWKLLYTPIALGVDP